MTNSTDNNPQSPRPAGPRSMRLRALAVLVFVAGLLGTAVYLDPARLEHPFQNGYRLLSPCGFLYRTGYPCPTCYMTRSFAYMMHGRPDKAFAAQPFGALLCLMVIYLGWGAMQVLYTDRPWRPIWSTWSKKWLLGLLVAAFLSGWLFRLGYGTFVSHEFPLHH